jgi:hydroxymethylpyrimidine/phosphomethylpyrimidine kinase
MQSPKRVPTALTIAGSDSGGGAGLQADLKTFAALGLHGTSVVTCLTAQNPERVLGLQPAALSIVRQQLTAVFETLRPQAIKTGMLFSAAIIREVTKFLKSARKTAPLIVDPVMVATSGARLLEPNAVQALQEDLLPQCTLVTPNVPEAEALTGLALREPEDLRTAARLLRQRFGCAVLIKGGHLPNTKQAIDLFYDKKTELLLRAPFIRGVSTHGTGCTYAAAIASYCALGCALPEAVTRAKRYVTRAIAQNVRVGRYHVLNYLGAARSDGIQSSLR